MRARNDIKKNKSDKETTGEKVMYKRDCRLDLSRKYSYIDDKMYISVSHAPINKTFIIDLIRYLTPTGFGAKSTYNRDSTALSLCLSVSLSLFRRFSTLHMGKNRGKESPTASRS